MVIIVKKMKVTFINNKGNNNRPPAKIKSDLTINV